MYRIILVSLSIFLFAFCVSSNDSPTTIRQTVNGPVEGLERISSLGQKYYSFRGIPFAEAPITGTDPYTGEQVDRRFKAPEPLKRRWTDALKAHDFGNTCIQLREDFLGHLKMSEDCLFLNVHVPAAGAKQKTVLVWIHGGGFDMGDATDHTYGPDFLLSQDNIVVTIHYRLGIFGFLNLNLSEYTGNMGLKDQQLALKWVHENIEGFSGNKNEVLLFGQSAGAASVHFQMLNKESRKYFQRAFAASSSAFDSYAITKVDHVQHIEECFEINEMDKLIEYLRAENSSTLMECSPFENLYEPYKIWVPVIERKSTKDAFLVKTPEEFYNDPNEDAPAMDAMFSFTAQETAHFASLSEISEPLINENLMETTIFTLPFKGFSEMFYPDVPSPNFSEYEEALKNLRNVYFSNTTSIDAIKRANVNLVSDSVFNYGIIKAALLQANANHKAVNEIRPKNTLLFRFNVTADLNLMSLLAKNLTDATHTDDLGYLFHCHFMDEMKKYDKHLEEKSLHYDLIMRSVKMITNFARTGDPSIEGDTPFKPVQSVDEMFCQEVGNELRTSVTNDIRQQIHYDIWHEIEEVYKSLDL